MRRLQGLSDTAAVGLGDGSRLNYEFWIVVGVSFLQGSLRFPQHFCMVFVVKLR